MSAPTPSEAPNTDSVHQAERSTEGVRTDAGHERSVTLTGRQLRAALAWTVPDTGDDELDQLDTKVTIAWSDTIKDDDGVLQPPAYVLWFTDYPEEGCLPLDVDPTSADA